jgi:hypothetical protein
VEEQALIPAGPPTQRVSAITRAAASGIRKPTPRPHSDIYFDDESYDLDKALAVSAALGNQDNIPASPTLSQQIEGRRVSPVSPRAQPPDMELKYDSVDSSTDSHDSEEEEALDTPVVDTDTIIPSQPTVLGGLQRDDKDLLPLVQYFEKGVLPDDPIQASSIKKDSAYYSLDNGVLYKLWSDDHRRDKPQLEAKEKRPVIPRSLRADLLRAFHDSSISGHLGESKTYKKLRNRFYWFGMHKDIISWIRSCNACSRRKTSRNPTDFPLGQLPIPTAAFQCLGIDVLGPLPVTTKGNRYLLCIVDYYTRWPIVFPMSNQTAPTIAKLLVEQVFLVYGFPATLLSDRGSNFLSIILAAVLNVFRVKKISTTSYHPQTNGLTERFNSTLVAMLSHFINHKQTDWDAYIPYVLYAYRTSTQEYLGESPFYCLFGRSAISPEEIVLGTANQEYKEKETREYLNELRDRFDTVEAALRTRFDKLDEQRGRVSDSNPELAYQPGDLVMQYVPRVGTGRTKKLAYLWQGPFMVLDVFNNGLNYRIHRVSNRLQLVNNAASRVVNVNRLKKYYPPSSSPVRSN